MPLQCARLPLSSRPWPADAPALIPDSLFAPLRAAHPRSAQIAIAPPALKRPPRSWLPP